MNLYKEIILKALQQENVQVSFTNLDISELVQGACYQALEKIQTIVADDSLSDRDCFMKIEKIVQELEHIGCTGGARHDF